MTGPTVGGLRDAYCRESDVKDNGNSTMEGVSALTMGWGTD